MAHMPASSSAPALAPAPAPASFRRLLSDFPCLVPTDSNFTAFAGFVRIVGADYHVSIAADCSRFAADDSLVSLLATNLPALRQRLACAVHPHDFLVDVRDAVERVVHAAANGQTAPPLPKDNVNVSAVIAPDGGGGRTFATTDAGSRNVADLPPAKYYERLLSDLEQVGWHRVAALDDRLRAVDLVIDDAMSRPHTIHLTLNGDYPTTPPRIVTSLPEPFIPTWHPRSNNNKNATQSSSLPGLLDQFTRAVARYQPLFTALDDLDAHTHILEPQHPTRRDAYRRLAVTQHASLHITLDVHDPQTTYPQCRFLGSEAAIAPLRRTLNVNMARWDVSGDMLPRENLAHILNLTLPSPLAQQRPGDGGDMEEGLECGICYAYRLEDRVPDVVCDRTECAKQYHRECLVEWLRALPDTRESFGTVSGNCVYCEQIISVTDMV